MKVPANSVALALSLAALAACRVVDERPHGGPDGGRSGPVVSVPPRGTATTLDIASWNLEWFGDTAHGPSVEALQLSNARDVIAGTDFDIWGLEEIVSTPQFDSLVGQLPGYAGFLANDSLVVNGAAFYSDFDNLEQKVGLLYKTSVVTVLGASVILLQSNFDFAGRPPLEIKLRTSLGGSTQDIVVIVMHSKCCSDMASYQRRVNASSALKAYVDATYSTQKVWVIGDWNDDVDISIFDEQPSPYANFVTDGRYTVQTQALTNAHVASTVSFSDMIDHHMNNNEAAATYVAGSVEVYRVDAFVANYGSTTSDHFPVLSRYTLGPAATAP